MHTTVSASLERNEDGRLRVHAIAVQIEPVVDEAQHARMRRCLELFEDFCVVTQSVRGGIEVDVTVEPTREPRRPAEHATVGGEHAVAHARDRADRRRTRRPVA
jgi:hypothetical protein